MDRKGGPQDIANLYARLPLPALKKIRLFRLQAGQFDAPLVGTLIVADLIHKSNDHTYDALSYTWGAARLDRRLYLLAPNGSDEYTLPITDNLYAALQRLRHRWLPRIIWIDALCINQDDVKERSQQVGRMRFIYGRAKNVYVWLGDVEFPGWIDQCLLRSHGQINPDAVTKSLRTSEQRPSRTFCAFVSMLDAALKQMSPPWHTRAWVYQEHHLARNVVWCIGPYQQKYTKHDFARLTQLAYQYRPTRELKSFQDAVVKLSAPFTQYGISTFERLSEDSPQKSQGAQRSLHAHAAIAQGMRCRDAIDNVYSLLGVMDFRPWHQMRTDYTKSVSWVFAKATWLSLEMRHDYDVLLNARGMASPAALAGLPSWAFDYQHGIFYGFPMSIDSIFDIRLGIRLPKANPQIGVDHSKLYLTGLPLECVRYAGQVVAGAGTPSISTQDRFVAMTGALAASDDWQLRNSGLREHERTTRPAWPPADGSSHFTSEHEFLIDADDWKDILPIRNTHAELLSMPVAWASCITVLLTAGGCWGLMIGHCAPRDVIFVVKDCPYPLIIRKRQDVYEFRGCAYMPAYSNPRFRMASMKESCEIALV